MVWYIISSIAIATALALLILTRIRDRRFERMKASETMRHVVFRELKDEEDAAHVRRDKFRAALGEAQGNTKKT